AGGGLEVKPFGGLAEPGVSLKAEITTSAMGAKMKVGAEIKSGECGVEVKKEGGVGYGPLFASIPDRQISFDQGSLDLGVKSEATFSGKGCLRF
ncbi:MAG TPA: hypothetical protein VEY88_17095, partial [Archangium sp.]|nr:hypothetical protein [Archangium sp.]